MSLASNELLSTILGANKKSEQGARMATVTSVSNGKVYIKFYGETEPSQKPYKRISSYTPAVGDTVVLTNINNSYVITGKVV